ncbi:MAG: pilus assembly protein PilM [Butyrivibrio sp.]|nr:pilus assembly protein PilM [Butyrivibrio sp.]
MAKNDGILGIDIRHGKLSLSILKGGKVQKSVWADIPSNIVDDHTVLSEKLFSEFLKEKMKEHKIKAKKAAAVIADSDLVIRSLEMPEMDDAQLKLNIPFEFADYLPEDMKDYIFDFVKREDEQKKAQGKVALIAYAVPIEYIRKVGNTLRLAGLRLERAVPETLVYEALLAQADKGEDGQKDICLLDIGSNHMNMRMFRDGAYRLSHIIDVGENRIIQTIADELNVDVNLAETYLRSNYQECQNSRAASSAYKDISLEIIKGLNYYDMSDMTSRLKDVVLCGPGALTEPLVMLFQERIDKSVYTVQELFKESNSDPAINVSYASAAALMCVANGVGIEEKAAYADVKKTDWKIIALGIVAAIVALAFGIKIGIIDKYDALAKAQAREAELQERVTADMFFIQQADELSLEYYHYTWDDMTEEERSRVSRVEVAKLADFIVSQGVSVRSLNLTDSTLTVAVTGDSLNTMSKLSAALTDLDIVESCSLSTAQKESPEDTQVQGISGVAASGGVSYSQGSTSDASEDGSTDRSGDFSRDSESGGRSSSGRNNDSDSRGNASEDNTDAENGEEGEGTEDELVLPEVETHDIVNAEIKIYLAARSAENGGGE